MSLPITGLVHDHIDGSAAMTGIIDELYRMAGRPFPFPSVPEWLAFMRSDAEIPVRFDTVTSVLQTTEALELAGHSYGVHRALQGYRYVEAKFAPQYHLRGGLTLRQATDAMISGLERAMGQYPSICILPVICIGRETDVQTGCDIARVVLKYDGEAALDLVCNEAENPPEKHLPAYALTFGTRVRRDCHAGEFVSGIPYTLECERRLSANIRTAIVDLRCHSVGHAITLGRDTKLLQLARDRGVRVAGCPLSNLESGLIPDLEYLMIKQMLDMGICYTINPDDDLFLPPMSEVIRRVTATYQLDSVDLGRLERNVYRGALAADVRTE